MTNQQFNSADPFAQGGFNPNAAAGQFNPNQPAPAAQAPFNAPTAPAAAPVQQPQFPQQQFTPQQAPAQQAQQQSTPQQDSAQQQSTPQQAPAGDPAATGTVPNQQDFLNPAPTAPISITPSGDGDVFGSAAMTPSDGTKREYEKITNYADHVIIVRPRGLRHNVQTREYGVAQKVGIADVLVASGQSAGHILPEAWVMQRWLANDIDNALQRNIPLIVAKLVKKIPQGKSNYSWLFEEPSLEEKQYAFSVAQQAGWVA